LDDSVDTKYAPHRDGNFWAGDVPTGVIMNMMHILPTTGPDSIEDLPNALVLLYKDT
jgi:hypothetical protein